MSLRKAALVAAFFICSPAFAYHLVLEANPTVPFPFLGRFGTVEIHVYPAGHGFSCDERGSYHEASHKQALERTLGLLRKCVG